GLLGLWQQAHEFLCWDLPQWAAADHSSPSRPRYRLAFDLLEERLAPAISTTTQLTGSPNPATYGQSVSFNATITATDGSTPTGYVNFSEDGFFESMKQVSGGLANWSPTSPLTTGTHEIDAVFTPDSGTYNPSSSTLQEQIK